MSTPVPITNVTWPLSSGIGRITHEISRLSPARVSQTDSQATGRSPGEMSPVNWRAGTSRSSGGRRTSQNRFPRTSSSVQSVAFSQARLKRRILPPASTTMTREATMSRRLSAKILWRSSSASARRRSSSAPAREAKTCTTISGRTISSRGRSWIAFTSPMASPVELDNMAPT
jgi:hypothetical protein